jgi:hypothetical protein
MHLDVGLVFFSAFCGQLSHQATMSMTVMADAYL